MATKASPALVIAIGKKPPGGPAPAPSPAPAAATDSSGDLQAAMQEFIAAVRAGDAAAAAEAFKAAHEICGAYES